MISFATTTWLLGVGDALSPTETKARAELATSALLERTLWDTSSIMRNVTDIVKESVSNGKAIKQAQTLFERMDMNGDGKVDKKEFRKFLDQVAHLVLSENKYDRALPSRYAPMRFGGAVFTPSQIQSARLDAKLEELWKKYDIDGDEFLSREEADLMNTEVFWTLSMEYLGSFAGIVSKA